MTQHPRLTTIALVLAFATGLAAYADDISGSWKATFDTQVGQQDYTYLFQVKGTTLTGTARSANGQSEVKDGKVEGTTVTFVENLTYQGMDIRVEYTGTIVSADEIRFTRKVGDFATEELVATRVK